MLIEQLQARAILTIIDDINALSGVAPSINKKVVDAMGNEYVVEVTLKSMKLKG